MGTIYTSETLGGGELRRFSMHKKSDFIFIILKRKGIILSASSVLGTMPGTLCMRAPFISLCTTPFHIVSSPVYC